MVRARTVAAHTTHVTTSRPDTGFAPELRTRFGTPKAWTRGGQRFGVLLSSCETVIERAYDAKADEWTTFDRVDAAHDHARQIRRCQAGVEFEVVRRENGHWRDYLGRTPKQIIDARWAGS